MSKSINGTCSENEKQFAIINTTTYNNDGNYSIIVCKLDELESLGFDDDDIREIDSIMIGGRYTDTMYGLTAQVVRLG